MKHLFALLGHPVGHSLSPQVHNAVFKALGLSEHFYDAVDVLPEDLAEFMDAFRAGAYDGLSVTIPHKQAVVSFCDVLTERAKAVGAVNTVWKENQEPKDVVVGDNTDYGGFEKSLEEAGAIGREPLVDGRRKGRALVLGSGGAARAVIAVLLDHGFQVVVAVRGNKDNSERKGNTDLIVLGYDELDPEDDYMLIVNTTPVGMNVHNSQSQQQHHKQVENENGLLLTDDRWYKKDRVYVDIVYTPKMTPFLKKAQEVGAKTITGDRMFLWQAVEQAKLFTGRQDVPVEVMEGIISA